MSARIEAHHRVRIGIEVLVQARGVAGAAFVAVHRPEAAGAGVEVAGTVVGKGKRGQVLEGTKRVRF